MFCCLCQASAMRLAHRLHSPVGRLIRLSYLISPRLISPNETYTFLACFSASFYTSRLYQLHDTTSHGKFIEIPSRRPSSLFSSLPDDFLTSSLLSECSHDSTPAYCIASWLTINNKSRCTQCKLLSAISHLTLSSLSSARALSHPRYSGR
jgi:hypothetical protein